MGQTPRSAAGPPASLPRYDSTYRFQANLPPKRSSPKESKYLTNHQKFEEAYRLFTTIVDGEGQPDAAKYEVRNFQKSAREVR